MLDGPKLRNRHRLSAVILAAFLLVHIGNHLTGLAGQNWHMAYMAAARQVYRHFLVEPLLLALIVWQAGSGLTLLWRRRKGARSLIGWMQHLSGLYLAIFLLIHVTAVLSGRWVLGLDTDFRFAAAGFHVAPFIWFFVPYYFLAVLSLFVHAGCGVYWNMPSLPARLRQTVLAVFCIAGLTAGPLIVLSLAGVLYPVDIPDAYRATYSD
jgi:succinate dehydrogenase/fumarate reductase cytochrome b subunit